MLYKRQQTSAAAEDSSLTFVNDVAAVLLQMIQSAFMHVTGSGFMHANHLPCQSRFSQKASAEAWSSNEWIKRRILFMCHMVHTPPAASVRVKSGLHSILL